MTGFSLSPVFTGKPSNPGIAGRDESRELEKTFQPVDEIDDLPEASSSKSHHLTLQPLSYIFSSPKLNNFTYSTTVSRMALTLACGTVKAKFENAFRAVRNLILGGIRFGRYQLL